jgi:outer membrane protein TolC
MLAEQALRIAIGAAPDEPLAVAEDVLSSAVPEVSHASAQVLHEEAVGKRLELLSLERRAYSLEQAAEIESSRALPRLEAVGNLTYANPNQRIFPLEQEWNGTWDVGLQLIWSVNDLGSSSAQGRTFEAQGLQVRSDRRKLEQGLWLEIVGALGELERARATVDAAERGRKAADAALAARRALHQHGRATALELLEAETAGLRARSSVVDANVAWRIARVRLEHAVGRDVGEVSPGAASAGR